MTAAYDLLSPEHFAAPYETFALMRENDPLYWHEQMGMWFATRYQDVHAVTRDKRFSSARVDAFMPPGDDERTQAVRRHFTDWMAFSDPRRIGDFEQWSHDIMRVPSLVGDTDENLAVAYRGMRALEAYFRHLIAERRTVPADDLLGLMVQASEDGTVLSEHELMATCALLLIAGHETTTNLIGNATLALLRNSAEQARLRAQPDLAGPAVEEFLRYDGAVAGTARQAKEDVHLSGGVVPAGAVVMAVVPAANRDPAIFTDPDRLNVGRGDTRHLGFGGGPHACLGAALARMETQIAMTALLARYPRMELAVSEPSQLNSWAIRGVTSLPVYVG